MGMNSHDFDQARRFAVTPMGKIAYVERGAGPVALFIREQSAQAVAPGAIVCGEWKQVEHRQFQAASNTSCGRANFGVEQVDPSALWPFRQKACLLEFLPNYTPELNPAGYLWSQKYSIRNSTVFVNGQPVRGVERVALDLPSLNHLERSSRIR